MLITQYSDVFTVSDLDLGRGGEEKGHLDRMLAAGVYTTLQVSFGRAPVMIRKKGFVRWCVDYRALNKVTVRDTNPLSLIKEGLVFKSGCQLRILAG